MSDVVWFMDVDGVLNIFPRGTPPSDVKYGEASPFIPRPYEDPVTFPITWREGILTRIREMHESGLVKVVWLTTWGRGANYGLHELLGLPFLDVVADPHDPEYINLGWSDWWKAHAARKYIEEHNPSKIIWSDDDLNSQKHRVQDIVDSVPTLLISPLDHRGLTQRDLKQVELFLDDPVVQTREDSVK